MSGRRSSLGELAHTGAMKAAEALGRLTDEAWSGEVRRAGPDEESLGLEADSLYRAAFLSWKGAAALFCARDADAAALSQAYVFSKIEPGEDFLDRREEVMSRLAGSAFSELGNIVVHSVTSAWANASGAGFLVSAPALIGGAAGELEAEARRRARDRAPDVAALVDIGVASERLGIRCLLRFWLGSEALLPLVAASHG